MADSEEKEFDNAFYEALPFEKDSIGLELAPKELYLLIKVLGFSGSAFSLASKNSETTKDVQSAKIYAENAQLAFAFRNKLLDFAKVGQPSDSSKH